MITLIIAVGAGYLIAKSINSSTHNSAETSEEMKVLNRFLNAGKALLIMVGQLVVKFVKSILNKEKK